MNHTDKVRRTLLAKNTDSAPQTDVDLKMSLKNDFRNGADASKNVHIDPPVSSGVAMNLSRLSEVSLPNSLGNPNQHVEAARDGLQILYLHDDEAEDGAPSSQQPPNTFVSAAVTKAFGTKVPARENRTAYPVGQATVTSTRSKAIEPRATQRRTGNTRLQDTAAAAAATDKRGHPRQNTDAPVLTRATASPACASIVAANPTTALKATVALPEPDSVNVHAAKCMVQNYEAKVSALVAAQQLLRPIRSSDKAELDVARSELDMVRAELKAVVATERLSKLREAVANGAADLESQLATAITAEQEAVGLVTLAELKLDIAQAKLNVENATSEHGKNAALLLETEAVLRDLHWARIKVPASDMNQRNMIDAEVDQKDKTLQFIQPMLDASQARLNTAQTALSDVKARLENAERKLIADRAPGHKSLNMFLGQQAKLWEYLKRNNELVVTTEAAHVVTATAPSNTRWFFTGKGSEWKTLVIRKLYLPLYDDIMAKFKDNRNRAVGTVRNGYAMVLIGAAGIGKSLSLNHLVLLAAKEKEVTVVCHWGGQEEALVLLHDGSARVVSVKSDIFESYLYDVNTLYLYDPDEGPTQTSAFRTERHSFHVVAASPNPKNYAAPFQNNKNESCGFYYIDMWSEEEIQEALPIMLRDAGCEPKDCYMQDEHETFADAVTEYYSKANGTVRALMWKLQSNNPRSLMATRVGFEYYFDAELFVDKFSNMTAELFQTVKDLVRMRGADRDSYLTMTVKGKIIHFDTNRLVTFCSISSTKSATEAVWSQPKYRLTSPMVIEVFAEMLQRKTAAERLACQPVIEAILATLGGGARGELFEAMLFSWTKKESYDVYPLVLA